MNERDAKHSKAKQTNAAERALAGRPAGSASVPALRDLHAQRTADKRVFWVFQKQRDCILLLKICNLY